MTTATLTLSDFLLARIAEDEEAARAAADDVAVGDEDGSKWYAWEADSEGIALLANIPADLREPGETSPRTAHITRWDPARVLAECEAKRRIVELHELVTADYTGQWWTDHNAPQGKYVITGCANCTSCGVDGDSYIDDGPCPTLRLLALPYAEHPDYREEWRV